MANRRKWQSLPTGAASARQSTKEEHFSVAPSSPPLTPRGSPEWACARSRGRVCAHFLVCLARPSASATTARIHTVHGNVRGHVCRNIEFVISTGLKSIHIPASAEYLDYDAFTCALQLTSVTFASGLKNIKAQAFYGTPLKAVAIPATVEWIGDKVFEQCKSLASVTFAEGLKTIGKNAFASTKLTSITFPASVKEIG